MSFTLAVGVESGRIERAAGDLLVLPFFASDRPLRGPAARADWRLCGLLSERLLEDAGSGAAGRAMLVATGGLFRAPRLLALSLGQRAGFGADGLRTAVQDAISRALALGARDVGFALPPESGLGMSAERAGELWLEGVVAALAERPASLLLRLWVTEGEIRAVRRALAEAAARNRDRGLVFRWIASESRSAAPVGGSPLRREPADPPANAARPPSP